MTPLPKRRHSTRRVGKRTAAIKIVLPKSLTCANCGKPRIPHRACRYCGFYGGKEVVKQKAPKAKKS